MESFDHKMSKSDPGNAILLDDDRDSLRKKMRGAFLEVGNPNSPVFEIARLIIMPRQGSITVTPDPKYGKQSSWEDLDSFISAVSDGSIHPLDAKMAVADALADVMEPLVQHFATKADLVSAIEELTGSQ
jgi:tyrosyl-tRNA synthetase